MSYTSGVSGSNRVTGMVSGMDTDSLVKDLMAIEQLKMDKIYKDKTLVEWKNDALKNVENLVKDFRNKYMSALSPETNMYTSSVYKVHNVDVSANNSVDITANSAAMTGEYVINEITSLASGATAESNTGITTGNVGLNTATALKDLNLTIPLTFVDDKISFSINGTVFEFGSDQSLKSVFDKVNNSDVGVTMSYSTLSDKITLTTKKTGAESNLKIANISGNMFGTGSAIGIADTDVNGTNAMLKINGYDVTQSNNNFTIDGINYKLKRTTDAGDTIDFSVTRDTETTVNKIKDFVADYNVLVDTLTKTIKEEKNYNYSPLTDAQKEGMEKEDIEKWEAKAKSGLLKNDYSVSRMLREMRAMVYDKVEGAGLSLSDIGITTGSYKEGGKLVIDEAKLTSAVENNSEGVMKLFIDSSNSTDRAEKYSNSGLMSRMMTSFSDYTDMVDFDRLKEQIRRYDDEMDAFEAKMFDKQEKYYTQFAAMEKALSNMYSQSSWISQQFSSGM